MHHNNTTIPPPIGMQQNYYNISVCLKRFTQNTKKNLNIVPIPIYYTFIFTLCNNRTLYYTRQGNTFMTHWVKVKDGFCLHRDIFWDFDLNSAVPGKNTGISITKHCRYFPAPRSWGRIWLLCLSRLHEIWNADAAFLLTGLKHCTGCPNKMLTPFDR